MILYLKGFESFFSTKKPNLINHFLQEGNLFNNTKKKECFSIRKYYDFCRKRLNKIQIDINGVLLVAAHHQKRVKTVNLQKYIFIYKILGNLTKNEKKKHVNVWLNISKKAWPIPKILSLWRFWNLLQDLKRFLSLCYQYWVAILLKTIICKFSAKNWFDKSENGFQWNNSFTICNQFWVYLFEIQPFWIQRFNWTIRLKESLINQSIDIEWTIHPYLAS